MLNAERAIASLKRLRSQTGIAGGNFEFRMKRSWSWWRPIWIRAGEAVAVEVDHGVGFTGDPDIGFRRERLRSLTVELAEFMACLLFPAVA